MITNAAKPGADDTGSREDRIVDGEYGTQIALLARCPQGQRTAFTTSRLLEFCTMAELSKQVGIGPESWPVVIVEELTDNGLDAAEEAGVAPEITIAVSTKKNTITVTDNGPGIAPEVVTRLLDFSTKTSSREAYVAPTRGAQGNALQTLVAMPFALDGKCGKTVIEAHGIAHEVVFTIDAIRREPRITHVQELSPVQKGTRITLNWPVSASSKLTRAKDEIVQIVDGFGWLNPHASLCLIWDEVEFETIKATSPDWRKWAANDPAPAVWYDPESFARLIAACIAHDQDHGHDRTVREFIAEFRGCARSDVQKQILGCVGASRTSLRQFFGDGKNTARVRKLMIAMQEATNPVLAKDIGLLGKDHFAVRFQNAGALPETFQYRRALREVDGVPYALEAAFAYVPDGQCCQITGINWSPSISNPFRSLGRTDGEDSLDAILSDQYVGWDEPLLFVLHLACPRLIFTDKAKSALMLPSEVAIDLVNLVEAVTKSWAKQRKAEDRDAAARARRLDRLICIRQETVKDVAYEVMEQSYLKASSGDTLPANARQVMYAARPLIQERTGKRLNDQYFTQVLLPDYMAEKDVDWDVTFDDRGHLREPHTGHIVGLGTLAVRDYLDQIGEPELVGPELSPAHIATRGPQGCYRALLFLEKEGFDALLKEVQLAERYDICPLSTKGLSVTAARQLIDALSGRYHVPVLVLHDFDKSGFSILGTLKEATRRYAFENKIEVIDLGLRLDDIAGLQAEDVFDRGSEEARRANLLQNGATEREVEFLLHRRVELNAMTSRQFVAFVERKLVQHGICKIVPNEDQLADAYQLFVASRRAEAIIRRELEKLKDGADVKVPHDLKARVHGYLERHPTARWDDAVAALVCDASAGETSHEHLHTALR